MKFPPDLIACVRMALDRSGYCFFSADEIARLLGAGHCGRHERDQALLEFAELCGAEVETTTHLKSARFTPAHTSQSHTPFSLEAFFQTPLEA